jgi:hypothetical protein
VLSVEVHKVNGPKVISTNLVLFCLFFTKVPIALNATVPPVGTASGPLLNMVVGRAVARAVNVGVAEGVGFFVWVGVLDGAAVMVGVKVGVGGAPAAITMPSSEKPGAGVMTGPPPLLLLVQLSAIAPNTNNKTGATTSHLIHRENIKS